MVRGYKLPESKTEDIIVANQLGKELDFLKSRQIDFDTGKANDFQFEIDYKDWDQEKYAYNNRIFIPDTEYGGFITKYESSTASKIVKVNGITWRGLLEKKVITPPNGMLHKEVSGDLNQILKELIEKEFDGLYVVPNVATGVVVNNWEIDRFDTLLHAVNKLLEAHNYKLSMKYKQPEETYGYIEVEAVQIVDYSEIIEFSEDDQKVTLIVEDSRESINHLVCIGSGEETERNVLHLYTNEDGSIGNVQVYKGYLERAEIYEYNNASLEELEQGGRKRLQELQGKKKCRINIEGMLLELGDYVAGYDFITNTYVKKAIAGVIYQIEDGESKITYNVEGE